MDKAQPRLSRYLLVAVATFLCILELNINWGAQAQTQSPAEKCALAPFIRGQNGFLFWEHDFTPTPVLPTPILPYVARFNSELQKAGVTLILVPIPTKAALLLLGSQALSAEQYARFSGAIETAKTTYQQSILELEAHGIKTVDLVGSTPSDHQAGFFFKTDHHWSPEGAQFAAKAIRLKLEQLGLTQLGLRQHLFETQIESQRMYSEASALLGFHTYCNDPWPEEPSVRYRTSQPYQEAADLFEDNNFDLVLAGSSNSAPERDYNFPGFLEQELKIPVLTYAKAGRWLTGWLAAYMTSQTFTEYKPHFLIWEFPLQFLTAPKYLNDDYVPWFRHLIPSISGACSGSKQLEDQTMSTNRSQKQYSFRVNSRIMGDRHYLHLDTQAHAKKMAFQLDYKSGDSEQVQLDFSLGSDNNGQFYVELSPTIKAPLERVTITPDKSDWPSELRVQLCTK
jgi:alginate biosynthesis protein AlgX